MLGSVLVRGARQLAAGAGLGPAGVWGLMTLVRQFPFDLQPSGSWLTGVLVMLLLASA